MALSFRIGVDVGGTNTDGVLLNPSATTDENRGILAWHKSPTTMNPSHGIETVIKALLDKAKVDAAAIASVTIGSTHFINAVVEKDQNRLRPVAVIRLCGPFSRDVPPGLDWPQDLRNLICKHASYVRGGLQVDGELIDEVQESEIAEECAKIKEKGIGSIVINGIFSPSDLVHLQEERVGEWVKKYYPEADVVLSKEVANLGFIHRENAAILNGSIMSFAKKTIMSFQSAIHRLSMSCPVFLTQNDGTILPAHLATRFPIRTFSSGPTNSMCGAAFLVNGKSDNSKESMLVVDIGGTSTDVGMLLPSGLPRQASSVTEVNGVKMNFSCPDVKSIGLGGGSIVRKLPSSSSSLTIGPDSVGYLLQERALVFSGDVPTATDYAVVEQFLDIGNPALARNVIPHEGPQLEEYKAVLKRMLERIVDKMKTNASDIPVLLVGGGAILAPSTLNGASRVEKLELGFVANAIGAAIARVSATVDTVVSTLDQSTQAVLQQVSKTAVERAVANGAIKETVTIVEMDAIPLPYIANKLRIIIKAIGDFDFAKSSVLDSQIHIPPSEAENIEDKNPLQNTTEAIELKPLDITSYKPNVKLNSTSGRREWIISELDLEWISCGCYILGTGGGGNPYSTFVSVRELVRGGAVIRVVNPEDLNNDDVVACGGAKGSPTVSIEKLAANEMMEAQRIVYEHLGYEPDAVIALEIGGGNGLQGLLLGASCNMNIPTVDGDWMGRAYPVAWQITPVVLGGDRAQFLPTAISDGNGNTMLMLSATTEKMIERAFRAALSEMGSYVACAKGPCSGVKTKEYVVENTISLAWRIGRAVALCRAQNDISHVAERIIEQVGGSESARVLFKGKIVGVERKTVKGHVYGEVVIDAADVTDGQGSEVEFSGKIRVPFKNENIICETIQPDGSAVVIASVPDLICIIDAASGEAIGTPEYRYGLLVVVLGIQASEKWTSTSRGIEIGGPRAFGMDIEYKPLGKFSKPRSVIEEYMECQ
ncbi:hypothetical protein C8J56DRAFT_137101 [Mycena floridula]|nr:hypothetical protein C8J56DRAFT_137101 [Mycena floridula]